MLTGTTMSPIPTSNATVNDAVDHFFRTRGFQQLFTPWRWCMPSHTIYIYFFSDQILILLFFSTLNVFLFQPHVASNPSFCDFILFFRLFCSLFTKFQCALSLFFSFPPLFLKLLFSLHMFRWLWIYEF